ncbi:glycosyltransferase [Granulicella sp. 5B5]|uniref:glycosyltransferase family 4 protein n=1 Tax=Granulicella sp. 5B5 TaxID=1617967 RepID=UPI0015F6FC38|nr:glycosyltransferase family 1 protein [Granulicella sp. 5B5]QMV19116.1 glycosyltransferase [Granulicella sp. 5B5]
MFRGKMQPVYINGRFLGAAISGVPRYGREILSALDEFLAESEYSGQIEILVPRSVQVDVAYRKMTVRQVGWLTGHAWEQLELPFYSWGGVLYSPSGSAPLLHPRNVLTIHDAIVFAYPDGCPIAYRLWYCFLSIVLSRTAAHVMTVSEFSKREITHYCKSNPHKITVAYPGVQYLASVPGDKSILARYSLRKHGYVLAVGSSAPNKNFAGILRTADRLASTGIDVALVGKTGVSVGQHGIKMKQLDMSLVKDIGFVTDAELRSLYENAGAFIFPSFYEGFGLPPLEALSLGCPTVISNCASLPEVCGEVALKCDPHSTEDMVAKVQNAIHLREDEGNAIRFKRFTTRYENRDSALRVWKVILAVQSGGRA